MKRYIFNALHIFALKPLFFEKNEIKWNQTNRHAVENFSQFKSSLLNGMKQTETQWGDFLNSNHLLLTNNVFFGAHKVEILGPR